MPPALLPEQTTPAALIKKKDGGRFTIRGPTATNRSIPPASCAVAALRPVRQRDHG